ncbi:MAG: hypothetical protein JWR46_667 [Mycobacterium sp.]|nr:hypothetical protein [Mycobacterium sp.]
MTRNDWLVGGDRRAVATERIYEIATDLIARRGIAASTSRRWPRGRTARAPPSTVTWAARARSATAY